MDYKEYMSQLGKKSASLMTASQRTARARNAARSRWVNANGKHPNNHDANGKHPASTPIHANGKHELTCACGIKESNHDRETHAFSPI